MTFNIDLLLLALSHALRVPPRAVICIKPDVEHYNYMIKLLGRSGHLEEAKCFIDEMLVKPDGVTQRALLGACITYGNVQLGKVADDKLLKLEPKSLVPLPLSFSPTSMLQVRLQLTSGIRLNKVLGPLSFY